MEEKTLDSIESELSKLEGQGAVMNVEETPKQSLPVMQSGEVDKETVSNFKNQTLMQIQQDFSQGKVDADEGIKQVVNVLTIVDGKNDKCNVRVFCTIWKNCFLALHINSGYSDYWVSHLGLALNYRNCFWG